MPEITLAREGLSLDGKVLTNFTCEEIEALYSSQCPGKIIAIELKVHAPDGNHRVTTYINDSIVEQILAAVPSCRVIGKGSSELIDAYLIVQAAGAGGNRVLLQEFGLHRLYNGLSVFVAGDEVLGNCGNIDAVIAPSVSIVRLARNGGDDQDAAVNILNAISANVPVVLPIFMYTLLCSLRSQIAKLGIVTTFPVIYLFGLQSSGKSWLVEHYSLLYDDTATGNMYGNLDASSTDLGVIQTVSSYKDSVIAVDDLPKSSSSSVQRDRLEVVEKSIRFIANGSIRITASNSAAKAPIRCQAGAVYTGEISLDTASMLTRLLEVPLTDYARTRGGTIRADAAATFRQWMLWLLPHLDEELEQLKVSLTEAAKSKNARMETTKILFLWIVELFYRFAWKEDVIEKVYYVGALDRAREVFGALLSAQEEKVLRIQDQAPKGNLSHCIQEGYRNGAFHVVTRRKDLKSDNDCLVEKDALCIRTKTLLAYLCGQANFRGLTEKRMSKELRDEGALPDTLEKRAATKKINGKRFMELSFSALDSAAQKY